MKGLLAMALLWTCAVPANVADPGIWIETLKDKFAPDRRLAFFDVEVKRKSDIYVLTGETNQAQALEELKDSLAVHRVKFRDEVSLYHGHPALVNVSVCNIRSQPKHSAELSTQSLLGTPLTIYKKEGSWYYVQTPDGYLGWLDAGALRVMTDSEFQSWVAKDKLVVTQSFAFLDDLQGRRITDLVEGNILILADEDDEAFHVQLPDGRGGVLAKDVVVPFADFKTLPEHLLESILEKAHQMMGRPYLWGGTSGKGMDCSGFTKTVYYLNGLELPRDASQQVRVGEEVPTDSTLSNLQPGDFLFFGRKASEDSRERITHVAIYLGDGKMIHASERVRIESLRPGDPDFAPHRLRTLVRAKRMHTDVGRNGVIRLAQHPAYR